MTLAEVAPGPRHSHSHPLYFRSQAQTPMPDQSFKVSLSLMDNPDKLKIVTVEGCRNIDDCIGHIWATEKGWVIDAIKPLD